MKSKKNYFWAKFAFVVLALVAMPLANLQAQNVGEINVGTGLVGADITNESLKTAFPPMNIDANGATPGDRFDVILDASYAPNGEISFGTINLTGGKADGADGGRLAFTGDSFGAGSISNTITVKATSLTLSTGESVGTFKGGSAAAYFHALETGNITLNVFNTSEEVVFETNILKAGNITINSGNKSDVFYAGTSTNFTVKGDATKRLAIGNLVINADVGLGSTYSNIKLNDSQTSTLGVDMGDIIANLNSNITDPGAVNISPNGSNIRIHISTNTSTEASNFGNIVLSAVHAKGTVQFEIYDDNGSGYGKLLTVKSVKAIAKDAINGYIQSSIIIGGFDVAVAGAVEAITAVNDAAISTTGTADNSSAYIDFSKATDLVIGGAVLVEAKTVTAGTGKALSGILGWSATKIKAGAISVIAEAKSIATSAISATLAESTINFNAVEDFEVATLTVEAKADGLLAPTGALAKAVFNTPSIIEGKIGGDLKVNAEFNNQDSTNVATTDIAVATATIGGPTIGILEVAGNVNVTAKSTEVASIVGVNGAKAELAVNSLEAIIKGGNVTVETIGKATAKAEFRGGLNFSYSNGGNILVATDETAPISNNAQLTISGPLSLSGGNANSIVVKNANFLHGGLNKLIVGNEFSTNNAGTTLKLDLATNATTGPISSVTIVDFYTSGAGVGDTILTVNGLDTTTDVLDLNAVTDANIGVGLAGNKLKVGESLILVAKSDYVTPGAFGETALTNALNSNGIYKDDAYLLEWDANGVLTLKLAANAKSEQKGVIGNETPDVWFKNPALSSSATVTGTNGTVNALSTADWDAFYEAVNKVPSHPYHSMNDNAKGLYYNLAHINVDPSVTIYDWVGTDNRAIEFRQTIGKYFSNIIPNIVSSSAGTVTEDQLIAQFMRSLDPQIYVNSGAFIASIVNKSFNNLLNKVASSNSALAYWENVAAGDNNNDWTIWAQTTMAWENFRDNGGYIGYTSNNYFGSLGADRRVNDFRIGLAGIFGRTEIDWNAYGAETEANSFLIKAYAEYEPSDLIVGLAIGAGNTAAKTERYTGVGILDKNKADYDVSLFAVDTYVAYRLYSSNLEFLPKVSLSYLHSKQDAIKERGNVPLNLGSVENDSLIGSLSVEIKAPLKLEAGHIIKPKVKFGISQEFGDRSNTLRTAFPGQGGVAIDSKGLRKKRTSLDVGVGVEAYLNNGLNVFAEYEAEIQSNYTNQNVSLGLEYKF